MAQIVFVYLYVINKKYVPYINYTLYIFNMLYQLTAESVLVGT